MAFTTDLFYSILLLTGCFLLIPQDVSACEKRVCFYDSSARNRPGDAKFWPKDIDYYHCTHIVYGFAQVHESSIYPENMKQKHAKYLYSDFTGLRQKNPKLKALLSVGGPSHSSEQFSRVVASPTSRRFFAQGVIKWLRKHKFDGLDLNWQFPGNIERRPYDKHKFTLLVEELSKTFKQEANPPNGTQLMLTATVSANKYTVEKGYEVTELHKYLDFINVMAFDFHGYWDNKTAHSSPLYSDDQLNVYYGMKLWERQGVPAEKLILGVAFYGQTFRLKKESVNGLGAPTQGPGAAQNYTRIPGKMAYFETCVNKPIHRPWWTHSIWRQRVHYYVTDYFWAAYPNPVSVKAKARHTMYEGYGGFMIWDLSMDDFSGKFCGKDKYPLFASMLSICKVYYGYEDIKLPEWMTG